MKTVDTYPLAYPEEFKSGRYWKCKNHDWGNGPGSCEVYYTPDQNGEPYQPPTSGSGMNDNSIRQLMPEGWVPPKH